MVAPEPSPAHNPSPIVERLSEGGLRAPAEYGTLRKLWWWFDFLILVKLARLRFVGILVVIGLLIVYWDTLAAYYDKWTRQPAQEASTNSDTEFFCPMHPTVVRATGKEKCPICFMPLSKRRKSDAAVEPLPAGIVSRVQLSPYRVVLAGIQTWTVDYVPLTKTLRTVGYIEFNEREQKQVSARVKGRLDQLYVNETGRMVQTGEPLTSLYSPDLVVTVQNLLDATRSGNASVQRVARDRLTLWGISEDQIQEILRTGKANTHLTIRSPITGHVIKRYVREGQYVDEGTALYDVANLSTVWIEGQVYEEDIPFLPPQEHFHDRGNVSRGNLPVVATTQSSPTERFPGTLTFVHPHLDQQTRTVTVRVELNNPNHRLRPGASATVELLIPPRRVPLLQDMLTQEWVKQSAIDLLATYPASSYGIPPLLVSAARHLLFERGRVLAVPEAAVIDTGSMRIVYRELEPGEYEGVVVELGPRMTDATGVTFFPVITGLKFGDKVVTAGSFLVDAETRLNPAAGSIYFGGTGGSKGSASPASVVRPSTPQNQDAKIKTNLASLAATVDRIAAEAQGYCPVNRDTRLGSMGPPVKVMLKGKPVFLC